MSGKCDDCNVSYIQFKATSRNKDGLCQTKRYYRCPKCNTIYIEILPVNPDDDLIVEKIRPEVCEPVENTVQTKLM